MQICVLLVVLNTIIRVPFVHIVVISCLCANSLSCNVTYHKIVKMLSYVTLQDSDYRNTVQII